MGRSLASTCKALHLIPSVPHKSGGQESTGKEGEKEGTSRGKSWRQRSHLHQLHCAESIGTWVWWQKAGLSGERGNEEREEGGDHTRPQRQNGGLGTTEETVSREQHDVEGPLRVCGGWSEETSLEAGGQWRREGVERRGGRAEAESPEGVTGRERARVTQRAAGLSQPGRKNSSGESLSSTLLLGGPQIFSLIIFSSLLTDGYQNKTESPQLYCVINSNSVACSFAVGAGFMAFVSCLAFLALDAHEGRVASTRFKTAFQLLDFILAGEPPGPPPGASRSCARPDSPVPTGPSPWPPSWPHT